jgi:hypothetical protein
MQLVKKVFPQISDSVGQPSSGEPPPKLIRQLQRQAFGILDPVSLGEAGQFRERLPHGAEGLERRDYAVLGWVIQCGAPEGIAEDADSFG